MSSEIELDDLSSPPKQEDESLSGGVTPPKDDQVVTVWAWVSSILLLTLEWIGEPTTPLEAFLALHTGILLIAIALAIVFNVPSAPVTTPSTDQVAQGHPLLAPLSGACILIAFLSYNTTSVGSLAFLLFLGSATVGLWGLWR
ncbi:hypothetical protein A0H81_04325 [Grifola frondosa]|uniref:Uncharacterized protein n=1 Tax=Grifola frondosa TaxID=5627 RepID=A0A1C7MFV2_GRIFR|nr:hypothetical protein A0H81_04325 [Grifola frondosa]